MQRPRQHIIETESKKSLNSIIPDHWVLRELAPDYGLDFMVEIFKKENSTGNIFYLQLKGSDQAIEDNVISYQLKKEHIEYYNSIPSPVLFVLFSTTTNQFWGLWSNQLKDVLIEESSEQKTYKLNLDKGHIIDKSFFVDLESTFSIDLPKKVNISINSEGENGTLYHQQVLKWIKFYYADFVEVNNSLLPSIIKFEYKDISDTKLSVSITTSKKKFDLDPIDLNDDTFLYLPILDVNHSPRQLNEVLILVSFLLHKYNIRNSIELLIKNFGNYVGQLLNPIFLFEIIKKGIESNSILEIQNFSKATIEKDRLDIFQLVNFSILTFNNEGRLTDLYQSNLLNAIEKLEDKSLIGTFSYNLANSYRSTHELFLASKFYQNARKNKPEYLNKFYWWFEYAGVMFLSSHYCFSEKFYKKSYELNSEHFAPLIFLLLGDSLFFQGKFSEAKDEFDKFLNVESEFSFEEIFLKRQVCENFILAKLDKVSFDFEKSRELTEKAFKDKNPEMLTEAIASFPLNGLAWFNYGVFLKDNNDNKNAFTAFLTAACIQDWDKEAWKNCFLISLNLNNQDGLLLIYNVILNKFGIESVNYIAEHLLKDPNLEKGTKIKLIKAFSDLATTRK
ncbi:DUF4365 domain-containing protein [Flavobacterium columnare]|uniref:DUF4365 domain-containing protein n=1 Tax=Flavobacterium columnare TaxID=996 RepID=UPI0013D7DC28|nr:DUF4365 domain-containing protein [Flavobacterium columnare]